MYLCINTNRLYYFLLFLHAVSLETDEVADALDELLNEDQINAELEPSEDYIVKGSNAPEGPPDGTDRWFKKKWTSWKKSAEDKWKDAKKKTAEDYLKDLKKSFSWKKALEFYFGGW